MSNQVPSMELVAASRSSCCPARLPRVVSHVDCTLFYCTRDAINAKLRLTRRVLTMEICRAMDPTDSINDKRSRGINGFIRRVSVAVRTINSVTIAKYTRDTGNVSSETRTLGNRESRVKNCKPKIDCADREINQRRGRARSNQRMA